jgi:Flp pilus assembly protein TadG
MKNFRSCLASYINDRRGIGAIEVVLILPVFVTLLAIIIELSNLAYYHKKVQSVAVNVSTVATSQQILSNQNIEDISDMPRFMVPNLYSSDYRVVMTLIQKDRDYEYAHVVWQKAYHGDAALQNSGSVFSYVDTRVREDNALDINEMAAINFKMPMNGLQLLVVEFYMRYDDRHFALVPGSPETIMYTRTPPSSPRNGRYHFHPDDL